MNWLKVKKLLISMMKKIKKYKKELIFQLKILIRNKY
jgi:hypothetical protein